MPNNLTDTQVAFLTKFMGVKLPSALPADAAGGEDDPPVGAGDPDPISAALNPVADLADQWEAARSEVSARLDKLFLTISTYDDPDTQRIAEFGLNELTVGNNTALIAGLLDFGRASDAARGDAAGALVKSMDSFRQFLASDKTIELLDNNPFGTNPRIVETLTATLNDIQRQVTAAS